MRWRVIAFISLGVNLLLAALWLLTVRHRTGPPLGAVGSVNGALASGSRTNLVVRRQYFSWREIESADYPTYIANLREIGCPEQTIRDIIIADVNSLYSRRRATEMVTPEQQWWRSEPDTNVLLAAAQKSRELEDDRHALLTRLLGSNWESGDMASLPRPSRPGVVLDGPVLGSLSTDTRQALQEVSARSQDRLNAYLEAQQREGKDPDPVELAKLRQQTRQELQKYLSPLQLEEYLLRYSQDSNNLRAEFGQLKYFNATPDEFRAIFRATDALDQRIDLLAGNDPNTVAQRKALQDERENQIKTALGPDRYQQYRLLHDPVYRDAVAQAQDAGTPDAVGSIYAINLAGLSEQASIRGNTNLTSSQRDIELKRLELEQMQANAVATGQQLPPEPAAQPQPPRRPVYVVGPGDNAATIATIYGLPVSALRAANPGVDLNRLRPGDRLTIPRNPLNPSPAP
jgi:hypothetical protein